MKREIKFRAWDKFDGEMLTPGQSEIFRLMMLVEQGVKEKDRFILMQYTGLKDKKGKEIYEGDIVNTKDFNGGFTNVVVEWDDAQFTTIIKPLNRLIDIVVIGNIYENKELLDK